MGSRALQGRELATEVDDRGVRTVLRATTYERRDQNGRPGRTHHEKHDLAHRLSPLDSLEGRDPFRNNLATFMAVTAPIVTLASV